MNRRGGRVFQAKESQANGKSLTCFKSRVETKKRDLRSWITDHLYATVKSLNIILSARGND